MYSNNNISVNNHHHVEDKEDEQQQQQQQQQQQLQQPPLQLPESPPPQQIVESPLQQVEQHFNMGGDNNDDFMRNNNRNHRHNHHNHLSNRNRVVPYVTQQMQQNNNNNSNSNHDSNRDSSSIIMDFLEQHLQQEHERFLQNNQSLGINELNQLLQQQFLQQLDQQLSDDDDDDDVGFEDYDDDDNDIAQYRANYPSLSYQLRDGESRARNVVYFNFPDQEEEEGHEEAEEEGEDESRIQSPNESEQEEDDDDHRIQSPNGSDDNTFGFRLVHDDGDYTLYDVEEDEMEQQHHSRLPHHHHHHFHEDDDEDIDIQGYDEEDEEELYQEEQDDQEDDDDAIVYDDDEEEYDLDQDEDIDQDEDQEDEEEEEDEDQDEQDQNELFNESIVDYINEIYDQQEIGPIQPNEIEIIVYHPITEKYGYAGWSVYNKMFKAKLFRVETGPKFLAQILNFYMTISKNNNKMDSDADNNARLTHFINNLVCLKETKKLIECKRLSTKNLIPLKLTLDILEHYYRNNDSPTFKFYTNSILPILQLFYTEISNDKLSYINRHLTRVLEPAVKEYSKVIKILSNQNLYLSYYRDQLWSIRNLSDLNDYSHYYQ